MDEARDGNGSAVRRSWSIHLARWLGLVFVAGGFAAIGLAWAGAALRDCLVCQVPYLISGGLGGVALVVLGVGLLIVAQIRSEGMRRAEHPGPGLPRTLGRDPGTRVEAPSPGPRIPVPRGD